jgi:DNA-binding NtrC family response regulator
MKRLSVPLVDHRFFGMAPESPNNRPVNFHQSLREQFIGESHGAKQVRAAIAAHTVHEQPILIQGEAGTGRELVARLIHQGSSRHQGPFVMISCAHIAEESLEAALFGWIRELPSGRNRIQRGLVETACGGTLYISESSSASDVLKAKINRLIQHQEFRRVGDHGLEEADVRVILGVTNHPFTSEPQALSRSWSLADVVTLPSLRSRRTDIVPLARHFIGQFCEQTSRERRELVPETIALFQRYHWPGNVGELRQVVHEMVQSAKPPRLEPSLCPAVLLELNQHNHPPMPPAGIDLSEEIRRFEKTLLCEALKRSRGRQTKAARLLGLKLTTLNAKINRHDIDVAAFRQTP